MNGNLSQLAVKIKNLFFTGKLSKRNDDGSIQITTVYGRTLEAKETFPYGFITKAKVGKVTVLCAGGSLDSVKVYPVESVEGAPELEDGDVAIYTEGGSSVVCRNDGTIELNGTDLGGLIKAEEFKTQLEKLTARVDGVIDAIKNGVPVPQDGGAGFKTSIVTALSLLLDKENFADIESDKVTHGTG